MENKTKPRAVREDKWKRGGENVEKNNNKTGEAYRREERKEQKKRKDRNKNKKEAYKKNRKRIEGK